MRARECLLGSPTVSDIHSEVTACISGDRVLRGWGRDEGAGMMILLKPGHLKRKGEKENKRKKSKEQVSAQRKKEENNHKRHKEE